MGVVEVSPFDSEVYKLIESLNEHNLSYYPPEECHLDPPEVLAADNCTMVGFYKDQKLCGIGAIKFFEDYGEIKRMFVPDEFRGQGIANAILENLIERVIKKDKAFVRLETGIKFKAAVGLYEKHGFKKCEPFGQYAHEIHGTCMEKPLKEKKQFKPPEIIEAVEVFDADQSGKIDKNELRKLMCELGEPYSTQEFAIFLGEADPEGTGKIDYKAFVANVTAKKKDKAEE